MLVRFFLVLLIAFLVSSAGFATYYWVAYTAGQNLFKEYIVVYHQVQTVRTVSVDGRDVQQRYYETRATPPTTRWKLILPVVIINNTVILVLLGALALWYSHKFAGPAFRIKSVISRSLAGEPDIRIHLRDGDELKDLAEQINKLLEQLDRRRT